MIVDFQLVQVLATESALILNADEIFQHRSFAALRYRVKLELRLAAGLFRSQILKQCGVFE